MNHLGESEWVTGQRIQKTQLERSWWWRNRKEGPEASPAAQLDRTRPQMACGLQRGSSHLLLCKAMLH